MSVNLVFYTHLHDRYSSELKIAEQHPDAAGGCLGRAGNNILHAEITRIARREERRGENTTTRIVHRL